MQFRTMSVTVESFLTIGILFVGVQAIYPQQPKILTEDGNLLIEPAYDKNISIRLQGSSSFLLNDIDLLGALSKTSRNSAPRESRPNKDASNVDDVRRILEDLTKEMASLRNRTTSPVTVRGLQRRVFVLIRRVNAIERKLREDDCEDEPCKNGGTCLDLYDDFHCQCPVSWTGPTCNQDVDECALYAGSDLGCQNNAQCVNTNGSYRCVCEKGFSGVHCRDRSSECSRDSSGELCGNGVCVPSSNQFGYACICDQGWTSDASSPACTVDVNECDNGRSPCHTTCINLPGSFQCGPCPTGYTGNGMTCVDVNECDANNGGCSTAPSVRCINTEGSFHCGRCPPGWVGDGKSCTLADSNACSDNSLCHPQASCLYISDTVVCKCPSDMVGDGYGLRGCVPTPNACKPNPCKNNGICLPNLTTGYKCICLTGFDAPNCTPSNPCSPNPCKNGGTCSDDGNGLFRCACLGDFAGKTCSARRGECGTLIAETEGVFKFPAAIHSGITSCAWMLRTDEDKVLNVTFAKFDFEDPRPECSVDWLQIHDGRSSASHLIGRFCGKTFPKGGSFLSSGNKLYLWFRSTSPNRKSAFEINWTSSEQLCGGDVDGVNRTHGTVSSPGYPGKSPPSRDCKWKLRAPIGKRFLIRYFDVNLGDSPRCEGDTLKISDDGQLLEETCTSTLPEPIRSSTNIVDIDFHTDNSAFDSSFQVHYEVIEGDSFCGGFFTETAGDIKLPEFRSGAFRCSFLFQEPPGTRLELRFSLNYTSNFGPSSKYTSTFIEIYDGKSDQDKLIGRWANAEPEQQAVSSSNSMLLKYSYDAYFIYKPLHVHYRLFCDEDISVTNNGSIQSPGYPTTLYQNITCEYTLTSPMHTSIILTAEDFDFGPQESESQEECNENSLNSVEIKFGTFKSEFICNSIFPSEVVSATNRIKIILKSKSRNRRGFKLSYKVTDLGCGGVLTEPQGVISYSANNGDKRNCMWVIEAPEDKQVTLEFERFQIGESCSDNSALEVYANSSRGDSLAGRYCGYNLPVVKSLFANIVSLITKGVTSNSAEFKASYKFTNLTHACGGNFSAPFGYIRQDVEKLWAHWECSWVLHAAVGHQIELKLNQFIYKFNQVNDCNDEYSTRLEVRNGMTEDSPLIGRFCDKNIPPRIVSFTNHLFIKYVKNFPYHMRFEFEWQHTATGCGGNLDSVRGSIHSPHYPEIASGVVQCEWQISVNPGSAVNIDVIQSGAQTLCNDEHEGSSYLHLYDGRDLSAERLKVVCKNGSIYAYSSSNFVLVRYVSDDAEAHSFFLNYKTNCRTTLTERHGVIESPNFPNEYPKDLDCRWELVAKKDANISLSFSHLKVESTTSDCSYDKLLLTDMKNDEELSKLSLCIRPSSVITSVGNKFVLDFKTDRNFSAPGFRLEYNINNCGGHFVEEYGKLQAPNYPYSVNVDCEWTIETTPGKIVHLSISEVLVDDSSSSCPENGLIVSNTRNSPKYLLKECSIKDSRYTIESEGHTMYVRFYTSDVRTRRVFMAAYWTIDAKCGGEFAGRKWEMTSPSYPKNYPPNSHCEWTFSVGYGFFINYVIDMDIEDSVNCTKDALIVTNSTGPQRFCGKSTIVGSTDSYTLDIQLESDAKNSTNKGFSVRAEKACGALLKSVTNGFLQSTSHNDYCLWEIAAQNLSSHITLKIFEFQCSCPLGSTKRTCLGERGVQIYEGVGADKILKNSFCENAINPVVTSNGHSLTIIARKVAFHSWYHTYENTCGEGDHPNFHGQLTSPLYPNSYPVNLTCSWRIVGPKGFFIDLNFDSMDIVESTDCNDDYLEVREGSANGELIGLFCSNEVPNSLRVFESAWFKFRSDAEMVAKGFSLTWSFVRDNEITNRTSGYIKSPPLGSIRGEGPPFSWRVFVQRGFVIEVQVQEYLTGLKFFDGYNEDALQIAVDSSPTSFQTSSSTLYILADNQQLEEFKIKWTAISKEGITTNTSISDCTRMIVIGNNASVSLASPGYPQGYDTNLNCEWTVMAADETRHPVITVLRADFEKDDDNCVFDYLMIFSGRDLETWHREMKVCKVAIGTKKPQVHGKPNLKINMVSDVYGNGTGFSALLRTECGGFLRSPIGQITPSSVFVLSSYYYFKNMTCVWNIAVRPGRRIALSFDFGSERRATKPCTNLYAIIRDGMDEDAPILGPGKICDGTALNGSILTTSNQAYVKYELPLKSKRSQLWTLQYEEYSDCGGEVRLTSYKTSTNITTPNYPNVPDAHSECIWLIVAPPGKTLDIEFVDRFDLNRLKCSEEYVQLRDGATELSASLGKYCERPKLIRSSGNILRVKYSTNIAEPRNGFKAVVRLAKCGGVFTDLKGVVTSRNYPLAGAYAYQSQCEYHIKVSESAHGIMLNVSDIDLPFDPSNPNESDHLAIYGTSSMVSRDEKLLTVLYGNSTTKTPIDFDYSHIIIRFHTFKPQSRKFRGFKFEYEVLESCTKDIVNESGEIRYTISSNNKQLFCKWRITVPKGQRVRLDVLNVESTNPSLIGIGSVYDDFEYITRLILVYSNNQLSKVLLSTDNRMMIVHSMWYFLPNVQASFHARFQAVDGSICPPDLTDDSGELTISNIPKTPFICQSAITGDFSSTIGLRVNKMRFAYSDDMEYNDNNEYGLSIGQYFQSNSNLTDFTVGILAHDTMLRIIQTKKAPDLLEFSASYKRHNCGELIQVDGSQTVSLPPFPANYGSLDCVWHLRIDDEATLEVTTDIDATSNCSSEFVSIRYGLDMRGVEQICGGQASVTTVNITYDMYVHYHANRYNASSKLKFVITPVSKCGGRSFVSGFKNTNLPLIKFTSKDYKNNLECIWYITTSPLLKFEVSFLDRFFIESSPNCTKDYVEVRQMNLDQSVQSSRRFCGRDVPSAFNVTSNRLQIVMRTDNQTTADGFSLKAVPYCGGVYNVSNEKPIRLRMPYYQRGCNFTFVSESNRLIYLKLSNNRVNQNPRKMCQHEFIQVYKPFEESFTFCGDQNLKPMEITSLKSVTLIYKTKSWLSQGFAVEYSLQGCGGAIITPSAIRSPIYTATQQYPADVDCTWNVTAPKGKVILVRYKYFDLESSNDCSGDYVSIYKGVETSKANRVALMCGHAKKVLPAIRVDSDQAIIRMESDYYSRGKGFEAFVEFTKNCDQEIVLTPSNSTFTLKRQETADSDETFHCAYRVKAPEGYQITTEFKQFGLKANNANRTCLPSSIEDDECAGCDYIALVDSLDAHEPPYARFCSDAPKSKLSSSSNLLTIFASTVQKGAPLGFEISIGMQESVCGANKFLTLKDGDQLLKLKFPPNGLAQYPPNTFCKYVVNSSDIFDIHLDKLDLEPASDVTGKCLDYLQIEDGTNEAHVLCGNRTSFSLTSGALYESLVKQSFRVTITFKSNEVTEGSGFELSFRSSKNCSQTYTQLSGYIRRVVHKDACANYIRVPENYTIALYLRSVIFFEENCTNFNVTIYDENTNKALETICSTARRRPVFLNTNHARVDWLQKSFLHLDISYVASKAGLGCGGTVDQPDGMLTSPLYPNVSHTAMTCRWDLRTSNHNKIELNFYEFDMGTPLYCSANNLQILEILPSGEEKVVRTFCGHDTPAAYVSDGHAVAIVSKQSVNFDGTGWSLDFSKNTDFVTHTLGLIT